MGSSSPRDESVRLADKGLLDSTRISEGISYARGKFPGTIEEKVLTTRGGGG